MARPGGRLGIIAGHGRLPLHVANAARRAGEDPYIYQLNGESDQDWSGFEHGTFQLGDMPGIAAGFRKAGVSRVVMSGGVQKRPHWHNVRPTWRTLTVVPEVLRALTGYGDDRLLRLVIGLLEREGVEVVGAHSVAPDILAQIGQAGRHAPDKRDQVDIRAGMQAAHALGHLDIGQGAVSVGGRVVALEGLEGTDAMLERVAGLRAEGRLSPRRSGVLVKLCKPGQDMRADLPSVGPKTVATAMQAGLKGVAVEAGRSLVLDREQMIDDADAAGIFLVGVEPEGSCP